MFYVDSFAVLGLYELMPPHKGFLKHALEQITLYILTKRYHDKGVVAVGIVW